MTMVTMTLLAMAFLAQERDDAISLLRQVEAATAELRDFRAAVTIDRVDALTEESERRMGRVILEVAAPPSARAGEGPSAPKAGQGPSAPNVGEARSTTPETTSPPQTLPATVPVLPPVESETSKDAARPAAPVPSPSSASRIVLILDTYIAPDGRADESLRLFIYDAGWFAEIDHERKQFVNRQIVPPGETFDPLRVGEGPLPIPIGQRADDVLAHFDVTTAEVPSKGVLRSLANVRGVRLTPKSGSPEADETTSVDLFYDVATHLPRGVAQLRANGNRVEVLLGNPVMNGGITEEERTRFSIRTPDPRDGWAVDVRPWKRGEPKE